MDDQEKKLAKFQELSYEDKKKKLIAIFELLKDKVEFSQHAIQVLSDENPIDELVMVKLYEFILMMTKSVQSRKAKENVDSQQQQLEKIKQLHQEEENASEDEEVDNLLDLIDTL